MRNTYFMKTTSKCPKCENTAFEVINETPVNSNYELIFVRCVHCQTLVGVIDYYNVGALVKKLAAKLKIDLDKD
ncbi:MAG: hypothetical protein HC830_13730 [Bacteroidetes bacterium]|nr:hypothetical protein [Bacteroidota bacterium]